MTAVRRPLGALLLVAGWLALVAGLPGPVRAADVTFGEQQIDAVYGTGITFKIPVHAPGPIARLDIQLRFPDSLPESGGVTDFSRRKPQ